MSFYTCSLMVIFSDKLERQTAPTHPPYDPSTRFPLALSSSPSPPLQILTPFCSSFLPFLPHLAIDPFRFFPTHKYFPTQFGFATLQATFMPPVTRTSVSRPETSVTWMKVSLNEAKTCATPNTGRMWNASSDCT